MTDELFFLSATELAARIRRRDLSPVEVVDAFLDRIDRTNPPITAYVRVLHERAREQARAAEQKLVAGDALGPLHGVPVAIKDLFDFIAGVPNSFGAKPFKDFVPQETTPYVAQIEAAGAITLGKTNTPEFGHKGITDNYLWGPTSTPFRIGKNAGGSSGGSAAALAAGMAPLAQGSDAGGSIRIPASFCGVYGYKASFGRIANVIRPNAFLSPTPFIHSGPMARTVEDAALLLQVMAGPHSRDPHSLPDQGIDYVAATKRSIAGMRIAYSPRFEIFPVDPRVSNVVDRAVRAFEEAGAHVEEVSLDLRRSHQELAALWCRQMGVIYAEIAAGMQHAGIDLTGAHRDDLPPEFVSLIETGRALSALDYKKDDELRTEVYDAVQGVFDRYDLLVTPTLAVPPVDNATDGGTLGPETINGEPVERTIGWCLTYPINYTGNPAASIPAGLTDDGLPIGMQIVGRRFRDADVLAASAAFERIRPWMHTYPRD